VTFRLQNLNLTVVENNAKVSVHFMLCIKGLSLVRFTGTFFLVYYDIYKIYLCKNDFCCNLFMIHMTLYEIQLVKQT
jgi:hypothetical protein